MAEGRYDNRELADLLESTSKAAEESARAALEAAYAQGHSTAG